MPNDEKNPKSENRIPKEFRNPNDEIRPTISCGHPNQTLSFDHCSSFAFLISDFIRISALEFQSLSVIRHSGFATNRLILGLAGERRAISLKPALRNAEIRPR
jgi:hypothetical protein